MLGSHSLVEEVTGICLWSDTISKNYFCEQKVTYVHWGAHEYHLGFSYDCTIKNTLKCKGEKKTEWDHQHV